jgi:hypothetical protein
MTTIAVPRRRSDNLAQRWLRTGGEHARTNASSHHRKPTRNHDITTTFKDNLDQQAELPLSARRVINRRQGLCAPALTPSASAKSP